MSRPLRRRTTRSSFKRTRKRCEVVDISAFVSSAISGEHQVSEIAELTNAEMSTTSQRLRVLLNEDLVARRRNGRDMFYRLTDAHAETLIRNVLDHADPNASIPP